MKFKLIFSLLALSISFLSSIAQTSNISGSLIDTSGGIQVRHATISIIGQDSILHCFTRSDLDGKFNLTVKTPGYYNLLIVHPAYADYKEVVQANGTPIVLQPITLTNRAKLMKEAVVRQKGSIRIKGDTTVYLADSFQVDDNASVEELLKLLPGIEVDKDGKITTQGEQVQKVLVDGEEFFGDDPTVATRNLAAKVIDKVEVFDSKSDQAKFTGFDDGTKEKTINLKMKENMNHGVFGKVQGAYDAKKIYDNSGMINAFKNKRKLSAYAINSSSGTNGLNWSDQNKFGGSENTFIDEDDGSFMSWSSNDGGEGGYNGEGFPKVNNAGVHYGNKWLDGKHDLNLSASVLNNTIATGQNSKSNNYIANNNVGTIDTSTGNIRRSKASGRAKYEWLIDSTANIMVSIGGNNSTIENKNTYNTRNTNNDDFASSSSGVRSTKANTNAGNIDLTWKKKLKKLGRTISINAGTSSSVQQSDATILGLNTFGANVQSINQLRIGVSNSSSTNARLVYTEPLIKDKLQAEISLASSLKNNSNTLLTKVQSIVGGLYDTQIDSLSNDFESKVIGNGVGIKLKYKIKKINITIGNTFRYSIFDQVDKIRNINYDYNRFNLFPVMNFTYKISQWTNLRLSYNGNTQQPSVAQLQNVYDNNDPLNVSIGNPDLKQEYNQNVNINFWNYKAFTERSVWAGLYGGNTFKNIINTMAFESATGRTINSYANVVGTYNVGLYSGYNAKIPKTNFKFSLNVNANINRRPTIVNNANQLNLSGNWGVEPSLSYRKPKVFDAEVGYKLDRNIYINRAIPANNTAFYAHTPSLEFNWYASKRIKLGSDVNYVNRQAVAPFTTNFNRVIWNAYVTQKLLKQKNLELSLVANDILNQNKGNERNVFGNTVSERNFLTIGRNILLRAVYNFSHGPVNKLPSANDDDHDF